jgi:hypothetical protein
MKLFPLGFAASALLALLVPGSSHAACVADPTSAAEACTYDNVSSSSGCGPWGCYAQSTDEHGVQAWAGGASVSAYSMNDTSSRSGSGSCGSSEGQSSLQGRALDVSGPAGSAHVFAGQEAYSGHSCGWQYAGSSNVVSWYDWTTGFGNGEIGILHDTGTDGTYTYCTDSEGGALDQEVGGPVGTISANAFRSLSCL